MPEFSYKTSVSGVSQEDGQPRKFFANWAKIKHGSFCRTVVDTGSEEFDTIEEAQARVEEIEKNGDDAFE